MHYTAYDLGSWARERVEEMAVYAAADRRRWAMASSGSDLSSAVQHAMTALGSLLVSLGMWLQQRSYANA